MLFRSGAIDPWKYPAQLNFRYAKTGNALNRTDTLVALCYDASKSRDFSNNFSEMHPTLQRVLCAH